MSTLKRTHSGEEREEAAKAAKVEQGTTPGGSTSEQTPATIEADKAAEAAAAIAARLAQQYGGGAKQPHGRSPAGNADEHRKGSGDTTRDFEFFKDIEINDLRNRYLLTKGPTQQQILQDTGAAVLTKGVWYPDKSMATDKDPALYLHITAETQEKLDAGIKAVEELIAQDLAPLVYDRSRRRGEFEGQERDNGYGGRRKWDEEKLYLEFEPLRNFNIRAKTVGPGGLFVKWIQQETQTRVQIKGLGSGYIETDTGRESEDPIHINITGPDRAMIDKALEYAKDLYACVLEKHAEAKQMQEEQMRQPPPPPPPQQQGQQYGQQGGYGGQQQGQLYGQAIHYVGSNGQQQSQSPYNYQANQYAQPGLTAPLPPGEAPPPPPPAPTTTQSAQDASTAAAGAAQTGMTTEQWSAYWNSLDPASQAYYTQYYAAYAAYGATPAAASASTPTPAPPSSAPPPPPPSSAPPPPPPADDGPKGGKGAYGAVPPPPGL